jgi:hypothetical protein
VLIGVVVYTIIASFEALTLAVLYFDLRAREAGPRHEPLSGYQDPSTQLPDPLSNPD